MQTAAKLTLFVFMGNEVREIEVGHRPTEKNGPEQEQKQICWREFLARQI
jgi:hypothetical protein